MKACTITMEIIGVSKEKMTKELADACNNHRCPIYSPYCQAGDLRCEEITPKFWARIIDEKDV